MVVRRRCESDGESGCPRELGDASSHALVPEHLDVVGGEGPVAGHERHAEDLRLRDEQPVERVA